MAKPEKPKRDYRADTLKHFLADVLAHPIFVEDIPHLYEPGKSKLILVTGENASGKSLLRKVCSGALHQNDVEGISLSMQMRCGREGEMSGFVNAMVFGDESRDATGSNTAASILGAIRTSRGRDKGRHAIIWDEPDIGLSDNYAAGAALDILEFIADAPEKLFFAIVTTHRKVMLDRLREAKPHHIRLGDKLTLDEALVAPVEPKRPKDLKDANHALFLRLHKKYGV